MKIGFIIVALLIFFSINSYVIVRGWHSLPPASALRPIFLVSMIAMFLAFLGSMIFGNVMPLPLAKVVSFVGFSYMIIFVYMFVSFLVVDVVRVANYFIHFAPQGMATFRLWSWLLQCLLLPWPW